MIETQLINKQSVKKYKEDIILYLEQLLDTDYIYNKDEEVQRIYANMIKYIDDESAIVVGAFEEEKLLGFIWGYKILQKHEQRLHINYFVINQSDRGCGIGKKLLNEICNIAKKNNINKIELMVSATNNNAIKFYEKQNFKQEKIKLYKDI